MKLSTFICFVTLISTYLHVAVCDPLYAYAESGEINIRKVLTGEIIKTFKIKEYSENYIAMHYNQDLIFYAHEDKVYRIHLVDDNGVRKVSGKGELFTNPNADHLEVLLPVLKYDVQGLTIDEAGNKLYISTFRKIVEYDLDLKQEKVVVEASTIRSPVFHDGSLYFSIEKGWRPQLVSIFRAKLGSNRKVDSIEQLSAPIETSILTVAIDHKSNNLYYRVGSTIHMLSTNLTSTSYPVSNPKIVLSNSKFTGGSGLLPIAIKDRYLIWVEKSSSDGNLYLGVLNEAMNFISTKNIFTYGRGSYGFRPYGMVTFEHKFTSKPTSLKPIPCLCSK